MRPSFKSKPLLAAKAVVICSTLLTLPFSGLAQNSYTINNTVADAFLAYGPSGNLAANNYGGAGTLAIAPSTSAKGEFDSVIMFNTSSAVSQFNSTYGTGGWYITSLALMLGSNGAGGGNAIFNNVAGGNFGINWISDDSWVEGTGTPNMPSATGVNFNSIPTLLATSDSLGTYTYTPPSSLTYATYTLPLDSGLVNNAVAGGDLSLYFYATTGSSIGYLFNSLSNNQGGHPEMILNVAAVPEPASISLLALSLGGLLCWRGRKAKI